VVMEWGADSGHGLYPRRSFRCPSNGRFGHCQSWSRSLKTKVAIVIFAIT